MGPVKDRYIHYEKSNDQFTGRSVTAISYLTKEFAILPPHWDFTDSTEEGTEEKVDQLLTNNLAIENDVFGSTFLVLQFIFASICYHYENLDRNLHEKNVLRVSPIFISAARAGEFRKYSVVSFPWMKTSFAPFFTGIPPHVMTMAEIEIMKKTIAKQTCAIVDGLNMELDKRNIGGDTY